MDELPDGQFLPPMAMTCAETQLRTRVKDKLGRTVTIGRTANLTKPSTAAPPATTAARASAAASTHSYFNSAFTTVADALKTGNCTLIPNAMVYKVADGSDANAARGVLYIDRVTREPRKSRRAS